MAKPTEKRPDPSKPPALRVLPMQLRAGDRLTDETADYEVIGRPYTTAGGKSTNARVQRADKPGVTEARTWGSYEKVTVRRMQR